MDVGGLFDRFPSLQSRRLILRELTAYDTEALFTVLSDVEVMQYYDDEAFTEMSQARNQIDAWLAGYQAKRSARWGITLRGSDVVIGTCGYYGFHLWDERAAIGYELSKAYWRQGIMTEALGVLLTLGYDTLGLNRIEAVVMPGNIGSIKLLKGLGFRKEGLLREYEKWGAKGQVDLLMFAKLRRDHVLQGDSIPYA